MEVAIIIPAYNAAKYLPATIESVLSQTCTSWEMIVVNDGSTDDTSAVAHEFARRDPRIRVIDQQNVGLAGARTRGFAELSSSTESVMLLDADDLLERDAVAQLVAKLEADTDAVAAHGTVSLIDSVGEPTVESSPEFTSRPRMFVGPKGLVTLMSNEPTTFAALAYQNCLFVGTCLFRRKVLARAGTVDSSLKSCEDWELWLRLARFGHFAFIDRPVMRYRRHAGNMSARSRTMYREGIRVRRIILNSDEWSREQREVVKNSFRYSQRQGVATNLRISREFCLKGQLFRSAAYLRYAAQCCARMMTL